MNELTQFLKLNYDNYYKFLVSLSLIIFVLSSGLLYYLGSKQVLTWFVSFWLTIFLIISIVSFMIGMYGWKKRQDNLDELLSLDVEKQKMTLDLIKKDANKQKIESETSEKIISAFGGIRILSPEVNKK